MSLASNKHCVYNEVDIARFIIFLKNAADFSNTLQIHCFQVTADQSQETLQHVLSETSLQRFHGQRITVAPRPVFQQNDLRFCAYGNRPSAMTNCASLMRVFQ